MNQQQPAILDDLLWRLHRISAAYEMTPERMLNIIVAISLEELEGREDDFTICIPARFGDAAP